MIGLGNDIYRKRRASGGGEGTHEGPTCLQHYATCPSGKNKKGSLREGTQSKKHSPNDPNVYAQKWAPGHPQSQHSIPVTPDNFVDLQASLWDPRKDAAYVTNTP